MALPSSVTVPAGFLASSLSTARVTGCLGERGDLAGAGDDVAGEGHRLEARESWRTAAGPAQSLTSWPKNAIDSMPCAITDGKPPPRANASS